MTPSPTRCGDIADAILGRPPCRGCGRRGGPLCPPCIHRLVPPAGPRRVPHVDRAVAALAYEGPARALVLALKSAGDRRAAEPLVAACLAAVRTAGVVADVVTWVPAGRDGVRVRGFDHAQVLAAGLGRALGLPCRRLVRRAVARPDQVGLTAAERRANLAGAFVAGACTGAAVMVVDDVVTTGATAGACARALRAAGAVGVELVAACSADVRA